MTGLALPLLPQPPFQSHHKPCNSGPCTGHAELPGGPVMRGLTGTFASGTEWWRGRGRGCGTRRVFCAHAAALLPQTVTSVQRAGSHLPVAISGQSEQFPDTNHAGMHGAHLLKLQRKLLPKSPGLSKRHCVLAPSIYCCCLQILPAHEVPWVHPPPHPSPWEPGLGTATHLGSAGTGGLPSKGSQAGLGRDHCLLPSVLTLPPCLLLRLKE